MSHPHAVPHNCVRHGDCIRLMRRMPPASVDFILTDPPYICRYRSRDGQTVRNDDNGRWVAPAFAEMFRVLKPDSFCVSFYGWNKVDVFMEAWRAAGLQPVGHLVFCKDYASSRRFLGASHEQAYLLAKGHPSVPAMSLSDVRDWTYTGNKHHPTEKPVSVLEPLIEALCPPGGLVLDPFCGSGSTLLAARTCRRAYIGLELDHRHHRTALRRLQAP